MGNADRCPVKMKVLLKLIALQPEVKAKEQITNLLVVLSTVY